MVIYIPQRSDILAFFRIDRTLQLTNVPRQNQPGTSRCDIDFFVNHNFHRTFDSVPRNFLKISSNILHVALGENVSRNEW